MRCEAMNKSGERCAMMAIDGSAYCFTHEPGRAADRAAARKRGGYNRRSPHGGDRSGLPDKVRSMDDVLVLLDYTRAELTCLDNGIARARALIALASAYCDALEIGQLEARVTALEEAQSVKH